MNQLLNMLAQNNPSGSNTGAEKDIPATFLGKFPLDDIWQFIANIGWMEAVVFMAFGAIYLAYGWRIFKALVVINFAVVQFAPGGPIEQIAAELSGFTGGTTDRISGTDTASQIASGADSPFSGAAGLDPALLADLEKQFGFDRPLHERFFLMIR